MKPMLATAVDIPMGNTWAYEVKWDGMRLLFDLSPTRVRLTSRTEADVTAAFPEIADLGAALVAAGVTDVLLDGEIVAFDAAGKPSFPALGPRMGVRHARRATERAALEPVTFVAFDIMRLAGEDLTASSYDDRRTLLASLPTDSPRFIAPASFDDGAALFEATKAQGLEGIMAKRRDSPYRPGVRSGDWVKHAHRETVEVVVLGWRRGEGRASGRVGSLAVGLPRTDGSWRFVGAVGSGIGDDEGAVLGAMLPTIEIDAPLVELSPSELANAGGEPFRWCDPLLVAEIIHLGTTGTGKLRQPVFLRMRPDMGPAELTAEASS